MTKVTIGRDAAEEATLFRGALSLFERQRLRDGRHRFEQLQTGRVGVVVADPHMSLSAEIAAQTCGQGNP